MAEPPEIAPHPKIWRHERLLTEHAFDKLRLIDCSFAEFDTPSRALK